MLPHILPLLALAASVAANLNYLSPSTNHPQYAVRRSPLHRRSLPDPTDLDFTHGVASGDPLADAVILWTRAVPPGADESLHDYRPSAPRACVAWEVSLSPEFGNVTTRGQTETSGEVDYTVKVDVKGLEPKRHYYYRFGTCDGKKYGVVGRTKTLPAEDDPVEEGVKFAVYSCSNYVEGFFNVYGMSARKDSVDYVLHLGDYIYETPLPPSNPLRVVKPYKQLTTLRDYRLRHAHHKTDADLLLSHRTFPYLPIWDDHEVANNGWRSGSASSFWRRLEARSWRSVLSAGLRAYFEYMPVRPAPADPSHRIWRAFRIGRLADLLLLDTRYADRDQGERYDLRHDKNRTIMGTDQEAWLNTQLGNANATWTLLAQQIQFSNINESAIPAAPRNDPVYGDGWSGYTAARKRVLDALRTYNTPNPVVLSGDYHALWTADLVYDDPATTGYDPATGDGALGIELAVTSVTSSNGYGALSYDESTNVSRRLVEDNSFLKWAEGHYRGYFELEVRPERVRARYFKVPVLRRRSGGEREVAVWAVREGGRRLERPFGRVEEGWREGMGEL